MTERQKTIAALAVLSAAIGVYAEINYQAKVRAGRVVTDAAVASAAPSASSSAAAPPGAKGTSSAGNTEPR